MSGGRVRWSAAVAGAIVATMVAALTIAGTAAAHAAPTDDDPPAADAPAAADLAITVRPSTSGPYVDRSFDWILHVANTGPADAGSVVVADAVPGSMTVLGVSSDGFDCLATGNAVTCTSGVLAAGGSATIDIDVMVPASGQPSTLTNAASVSSSTGDPIGSNNWASASVQTVVVEVGADAVTPAADAPVTDVAVADVAVTDVAAVQDAQPSPAASVIDRAPVVRAGSAVAPLTLPSTGSSSTTTALAAASMLVLGGAMLSLRRSRRTGV